ncbi:MAG: DoxX family membrane protein [Planctomycetota bacterium]|nr:DoxX family membrane protein [Planctomycetota bacterium]
MAKQKKEPFFYRNSIRLSIVARIVFGLIWLIDAYFKFSPDFTQTFQGSIQNGANGQPAWIAGWFALWSNAMSTNPAFWASVIAFSELAIAMVLILGFMRRIGYGGGFIYSLMLWSVPEGFGGPYSSSSTDIGTGIVYAIVFLMLMIINAIEGASKYTLDYYLEKRISWWKNLAEFGK